VGYRRHVTAAASGSVLFGFAPAVVREAWIGALRRTAPQATNFDSFLRNTEEARSRGYAMVDSSSVSAIIDIGAPVFDGADPAPIAALTIPFLTRREEPADAKTAAQAVVKTAALITQKLKCG